VQLRLISLVTYEEIQSHDVKLLPLPLGMSKNTKNLIKLKKLEKKVFGKTKQKKID
jgi:hypothetical protein